MKKTLFIMLFTVLSFSAILAQTILPEPLPDTITLPTYTINGTVTDDPYPSRRASLPITGAKVYLERDCITCAVLYAKQQAVIAPPIIWHGYYTIIDSAITGASGTFSFTNHIAGSYRLNVSHADYTARDVDLFMQSDTAVTIELLAATASATVSGVVSQDAGMLAVFIPIPNCTVTVYAYSDIIMPYMTDAAIGIPAPIYPNGYTGVTDRNGAYTITGIPISENGQAVYATAIKPGYQTMTVDTALWNSMTTTVNFRLAVQTAVSKPAARQLAPTSTARYSAHDRRLTISLDHSQYVNVEAYLLGGEKVKQLSTRRFLAAGTHSYALSGKHVNAGMAVLRITGENFSMTRTIELVNK